MRFRVGYLLCVALVVVGAFVFVAAADADRAALDPSALVPWAGGDSVISPLEAVAARIASRIAGHPVTVRCETASRFRSLEGSGEAAGFVRVLVDPRTNRYAETATVIELTSQVCGALQRFAQAPIKPTRCPRAGDHHAVACFVGAPVARDSPQPSICWSDDPTCYLVVGYSKAFWHAYRAYAFALQVLAHESIHTMQAQAGSVRPEGALVEQQADCYGMQWIPWVAVQLGDSGTDPQSIASYYWLSEYRRKARVDPGYWSADCRPGGALDIRSAGSTSWP